MVQLKVYDGSNQYFLDLYDTDPIKLTLSIEDITDTEARSVFSRTFRVPSTGTNNQFFKHAFLVDGIDFDVTVKKRAEILLDGAEFKVGHVRLQKIYMNKVEDRIDYEIIFLGETRDFASALSEKTLSQLDLSMYDHALSYGNVTQSWQAYPEGGPTDGLFNGDILYPLISFGIDEGEVEIAYGNGTGYFNHGGANGSIRANRFKPMIRAKALFDRIFEEAGFTYTSAIADSDDFRQLYISAFGNEAKTNEDAGSANQLDVSLSADFDFVDGDIVEWDVENLDPGNNYSQVTYKYTVPLTGAGTYTINSSISGFFDADNGTAVVGANIIKNGTAVDTNTVIGNSPGGLTTYPFYVFLSYTGTFAAGDEIWIDMIYQGLTNRAQITAQDSYFEIPQASGNVAIQTQLDSDYKQVDFIKDMLTKFRLVMAPDRTNPRNFIIEPWVDYIATGELHDWSDKLAEDQDFQIEPLFFTQSARIIFKDREDSDFLNELNIKQYKEPFGQLIFDSGNELLKDTREITTNFAPTPLLQIEGASDSNFLIPLIHSHDTDENVTKHNPIKAITRILFYNGLFTQAGTMDHNGNPLDPWYFFDENTGNYVAQTQFPMASYWQNFDPVTGPNGATVNLNWQIERGYMNDYANFNYTAGVSMYTRFWNPYIQSLYNKYARKITARFILSAEDLFNFSFDDVIFVNGVYYRPEKVIDVQIGQKTPVEVQLIKLLDYIPPTLTAAQVPGELPVEGPTEPTEPTDPVDPGTGGGTDPVDPSEPTDPVSPSPAPVGQTNYNYGSVYKCDSPGELFGPLILPFFVPVGKVLKLSIEPDTCFEVVNEFTYTNAAPTATMLSSFDGCVDCQNS